MRVVRTRYGDAGVGEAADGGLQDNAKMASDTEGGRGLPGGAQVGGDDQLRVPAGDGFGGLLRLAPADLVQRWVGLALEASGGVPSGASVPEHDEPRGHDVSRTLRKKVHMTWAADGVAPSACGQPWVPPWYRES